MLSQDQQRESRKVSSGDQIVFAFADYASSEDEPLVAGPAAPKLTTAEVYAKAPKRTERCKSLLSTGILLLSDVSFSSPSRRKRI